ncbi:hypothetical protein [Rhodopirellula sallentina]|uniref:Uncharacterized protein n=1 Tax=Rhodopirellula sallentina SM41 TaxID=1263870 RepID=M5TXJ8_9BACT|nr:hypothetical protein [Rhodopirellula sallentina]EMI53734.1 hypothetical protein RSSM_04875 [Rhodopirellula sallentina SM41]
MRETNPQIESALNEISELVCQSLMKEGGQLTDRRDGLLRTLLMSGYKTTHDRCLMTDVESRVKQKCGECAMHRGGALSSITSDLSNKFNVLAKWEAHSPSDESPSKPANISSATDA